ncbi:MAG: hypothetical protein LBL62_08595 [Planctomycetaceae bacterium]|nr:hypothetical protein [Planctomycetaceae bacterium]
MFIKISPNKSICPIASKFRSHHQQVNKGRQPFAGKVASALADCEPDKRRQMVLPFVLESISTQPAQPF